MFVPNPLTFSRSDERKLVEFRDADAAEAPWEVASAKILGWNASRPRWTFGDFYQAGSSMMGWLYFRNDNPAFPGPDDGVLNYFWVGPGAGTQLLHLEVRFGGGQLHALSVELQP